MTDVLIGISLIAAFIYLSHKIEDWLEILGKKKNVSRQRIFYVQKIFQLIIFTLLLIAAGIAFGINYDKFGFVVSSIFAVLGIALFAQWSILSNVTASLIIFFFFPYRVGDAVRIFDDKEILEGKIHEITLFHVLIRNKKKEIISFPNSLVFQKAIVIQPKNLNIDNNENLHQKSLQILAQKMLSN